MSPIHGPVLRFIIVLGLFAASPIPAKTLQTDLQSIQRAMAGRMTSGDAIDVAVVIKGGISLGAYESGVNWTLLRFLRDVGRERGIDTRLVAAAGASAGAINGVLSAVYWCREEAGNDTLENNIVRQSWREIDIEGLLDEARRDPRDGPADEPADACNAGTDYTREPLLPEDNAVLSRRALRSVEKKLQCLMSKPGFRAGCKVAVGLTLTRAEPVRFDNAGVEVNNQRLVAPLELFTADDGTFRARSIELETGDTPLDRSVIYLDNPISVPAAKEGQLSADTLFSGVKASASFPVAFAPIKMSYCLQHPHTTDQSTGNQRRGYDKRCPEGQRRLTSYFVDGGVFDNDPLTLVRQLASVSAARTSRSEAAQVRFVNIDPGRRRQPRGRWTLAALPFNQPGDSIDVDVVAGERPAGTDLSPDRPDIVEVPVVLCERDGATRGTFRLPLYETGKRTRRFVGGLHTRPAEEDGDSGGRAVERWDAGRGILATHAGDEIRFFEPGEAGSTHCNPPAPDPADRGRLPYTISSVVSAEPQGLSTQLGFVVGAIESGRGARLYDEVTGQDWVDGLDPDSGAGALPLFQPARLTPLTGDFLFAFGAFLDERFRDFDYYAGVYDALYGIAEFYCYRGSDFSERCRSDAFRTVYFDLCPECETAAVDANVVFRHLVALDVCGADVVTGDVPCDLGGTAWAWVDGLAAQDLVTLTGVQRGCKLDQDFFTQPPLDEASPDSTRHRNELAAIGRSLVCGLKAREEMNRDAFRAFVLQLGRDPRFTRDDDSPLARMLRKADRPAATWFYPLADTAVTQLLPLEREDQAIRARAGLEVATASKLAIGGLALGGLATESIMADRTGWQWHLSSVPDGDRWSRLAPWLPNETAVDTRNGGLAVFWEAGWLSEGPFGIALRAAPYLRQRQSLETVEFAELSAFLLYRSTSPMISSYGIGPTYTRAWTDPSFGQRETLGASAFVGLLGDKLRVTYGVRSFSRDDFEGDDIFWQLSLRDLPGFAYWALRAR